MTTDFDRVLARYNERHQRELTEMRANPGGRDRDRLLLPVGENVGRVLHALAVARGARRLLELGTSYGYSTLFLADAARRTGGRLLSIDVAPAKQDHARHELADAGLEAHVEFHSGDARDLIGTLGGSFDFVLIDLWKDLYVECLMRLRGQLADGAIVVADNMLQPAAARAQAEAYRAAVRAEGGFESVLLPLGSGIDLSCFRAAD